jgi:outer membrane biosynthesis protein TonB
MPAPRKHRRPRRPLKEAPEKSSSPKAWLIALIIFSLLLHVAVLLAFIFIGRHTPKWPELAKDAPPPEVTLALAPPPPPQKPDFIPTQPQEGTPPQQSPLISDNDNILKSHNQKSRAPDEPLPDVTGHQDHSLDLQSQAPSKLSKPQQPTPPAPQKPEQQAQKMAAQPKEAPKPAPPDPNAIHPTDNPDKGQDTAKNKPEDQAVDANGLPVLPPIPAPTLAQQTPQTQPIPQIQRQASPRSVPSFAVYQSDVAGQAGAPGDNSPAAMATDLGRYKAKVYRAVGARWYEKVNSQLQVLGVGTVHITYTIYSDGHLVITADPDGSNPSLMLLHSLSLNSMTEAAPFDPFSDKMKKEVGDSYTDDFSFSIYGN